jgi:hypothetical protein
MLKHMFQKKLLIHIENRVNSGRFKPGGLTRFNLTRFFDATRRVNPV